jgi:HNH endonuclease
MDTTPIVFPVATVTRFWAKVNKDGPIPAHVPELGPCWLWTASLRNKGYGAFGYTLNGKTIQERGHRFSYMLHVGVIPTGVFVLHKCDTPACVNPGHLFLGSNLDNIKDMLAKGRHVPGGTYTKHSGYQNGNYKKGQNHWKVVLTETIVKAIREDYATGLYTYRQLAKKHGVKTPAHVCDIVKRRIWKYV